MLTPEVERAIAEIRSTFEGHAVGVEPDGQGGAYVVIQGVELGPLYEQEDSWFGGHITFQCPYSDVYPLFVRPDLRRRDGRAIGDGTSNAGWRDKPAVQISRRSNRLNPATDRPVHKFLKVIEWLRTHP